MTVRTAAQVAAFTREHHWRQVWCSQSVTTLGRIETAFLSDVAPLGLLPLRRLGRRCDGAAGGQRCALPRSKAFNERLDGFTPRHAHALGRQIGCLHQTSYCSWPVCKQTHRFSGPVVPLLCSFDVQGKGGTNPLFLSKAKKRSLLSAKVLT